MPAFARHFPGSRDLIVNTFLLHTEVVMGKPQPSVLNNRIEDNGSMCNGLGVRKIVCIQVEVKEEHDITTFSHCIVLVVIFSCFAICTFFHNFGLYLCFCATASCIRLLWDLIIFPRAPIPSPVTRFPNSVESVILF